MIVKRFNMKITRDMKIREVLALDEAKMLETLMWLAPEFERLRWPKLRRAMSGRINVEQAARIARIPLTEMLYVLNLAIGEKEDDLASELSWSDWSDTEYNDTNLPERPVELTGLTDENEKVLFVDVMHQADQHRDPMPAIAKGLVSLKNETDILLIRHPFDPIPLRDMFARKGYNSWAEERKPGDWYIYFYRPRTAAAANVSIPNRSYVKAFAAAA